VPGVGSLIIGTVHSEDSFITAVAHPQSPEVPQEEGVDRSQNLAAQPGGGETGLEGLTEEDKLLDPSVEASIRTVFKEPFCEAIVHCSSM
jgi:hypothetical protein